MFNTELCQGRSECVHEETLRIACIPLADHHRCRSRSCHDGSQVHGVEVDEAKVEE